MKGIHPPRIGHGDDHIKGLLLYGLKGFKGRRDPGYSWCLTEVQSLILLNELNRQAPVFLHDKGIIQAGHEKDFLDLEWHEIVKNFKMRIKIYNLLSEIAHRCFLHKNPIISALNRANSYLGTLKIATDCTD